MAHLSVALPARATAGTGNPTLTSGDVPDSICPYGWRLPESNGPYTDLFKIYKSITNEYNPNGHASTIFLLSPTSFTNSRGYNSSSNQGSYWTLSTGIAAYYVRVDDTFMYSDSYTINARDPGRSLRCLAC